jgi:hypothetical protein
MRLDAVGVVSIGGGDLDRRALDEDWRIAIAEPTRRVQGSVWECLVVRVAWEWSRHATVRQRDMAGHYHP